MARGDIACVYHQLTSCTPDGGRRDPDEDPQVVRGFETDVLETFSAHCKTYPARLVAVELPRR